MAPHPDLAVSLLVYLKGVWWDFSSASVTYERNFSEYTDDVIYLRSISSTADETTVANDLATMCDCLSSKGFRLNPSKIKAITVSCKKTPPPIFIKLQGNLIECVDKFHLGITITSDLTWHLHISEITSKAKLLLGFFYRVFRESGPSCLAKLYR